MRKLYHEISVQFDTHTMDQAVDRRCTTVISRTSSIVVKIGNSLKAGEETCEPIYNIWMQDILGKNSRTMNKKTRKYARG